MSDLTRKQIEAIRADHQPGDVIDVLCTMALRALDADDEIATLRAALLARGVDVPAYYTRTDAERAADAQIHARRITRSEAEWMTFFVRAHHEAQKPRALDAGWQPMSTAPRDGTRVLLTMYGKVTTAAWSVKNGRWDTAWSVKYGWDTPTALHSGEGVTAWMPLPPPCAEVPHE